MQSSDLDIMENWKKLIVMDPVLSDLLDSNLNAEQFISSIIADKQPQQVSALYAKLGTFRHAIARCLQKQVQRNSQRILHNFNTGNQQAVTLANPTHKKIKLTEARDFLALYNRKYENIGKKTVELKNCYSMLAFAKGLQKFVVLTKMLRSLSKGGEMIHRLKTSEILRDIAELCTTNDFSGIRLYENERPQINSAREALLNRNQQKMLEAFGDAKEIAESIKVAYNLGSLVDLLKRTFNKGLTDLMDQTKKMLKSQAPIEAQLSFSTNHIIRKAIEMADIQNVLIANNYSAYLKGYKLTDLFGMLWSKFAQVLEKSYKKVFESGEEWSTRLNQIRKKYPIIFYQFSLVPNQVQTHLLTLPHLTYEFNPMRQRFISSLLVISKQYFSYILSSDKTLFQQLTKCLSIKTIPMLQVSLQAYTQFTQYNFSIIKTVEIFREILQIIEGNMMELRAFIEEVNGEDERVFAEVVLKYFVEEVKQAIVNCAVGYAVQLHDVEMFQVRELKCAKDSKVYGYLKQFTEPVQAKILGLVKVE